MALLGLYVSGFSFGVDVNVYPNTKLFISTCNDAILSTCSCIDTINLRLASTFLTIEYNLMIK